MQQTCSTSLLPRRAAFSAAAQHSRSNPAASKWRSPRRGCQHAAHEADQPGIAAERRPLIAAREPARRARRRRVGCLQGAPLQEEGA
jgi:hypothetical protein